MHWERKETVAQRAARIAKEQQELEAKRLLDKQIEQENQEDNKDIILTEIHTKINQLELNMQNIHDDIRSIKEYLLSTIGDPVDKCASPRWSEEYTVREELQKLRTILEEMSSNQ